jgi:hypothetical protein
MGYSEREGLCSLTIEWESGKRKVEIKAMAALGDRIFDREIRQKRERGQDSGA